MHRFDVGHEEIGFARLALLVAGRAGPDAAGPTDEVASIFKPYGLCWLT
jgi:hypothetical protein